MRVNRIIDNNKEIVSEIPTLLKRIDEQIGINVFHKKLGS